MGVLYMFIYRIVGKFGGENVWQIKGLVEKVCQMNRSAKGLLIVTITLDGFSLANRRRFVKFA